MNSPTHCSREPKTSLDFFDYFHRSACEAGHSWYKMAVFKRPNNPPTENQDESETGGKCRRKLPFDLTLGHVTPGHVPPVDHFFLLCRHIHTPVQTPSIPEGHAALTAPPCHESPRCALPHASAPCGASAQAAFAGRTGNAAGVAFFQAGHRHFFNSVHADTA